MVSSDWAAGHDESAQVNRNGELRASGIARRRTEEKRAEAFFPLGVTTTAVGSKRDARAAPKIANPRIAPNEARAQAEVLGHRSSSTSTVQACTPVGSKIRRFWYGAASTVIALR